VVRVNRVVIWFVRAPDLIGDTHRTHLPEFDWLESARLGAGTDLMGVTPKGRLSAQSDNGLVDWPPSLCHVGLHAGPETVPAVASPVICPTWRTSSLGSMVGSSQANARQT
jgi:hypothetical protein